MYKKLFGLLFKLVLYPAKIWSRLADDIYHEGSEEEIFPDNREKEYYNNDSFLKNYLYPVVGIISLLTFIGVFLNKKEFDVQLALRSTINVLVTVLVGFYLASFILSEILQRFSGGAKAYKKCERFVGYSSALIYLMYMLMALFPEFFFLKIGLFYTVYIIWEGAGSYMKIPESDRLKFTIIASVIILISPVLIERIMILTMPGMKI